MEVRRKIQLGAVAVIANGLVASVGMTPSPVLANPCAPIYRGSVGLACPFDAPTYCQSLAPPSCTVTSASCQFFNVNPPMSLYTCRYD